MSYVIYTDGACRGNPGPTSWGFVVYEGTEYKGSKSGFLGTNTNNVGELTAMLEAMKFCSKMKSTVVIYTDSSYVLNSLTKWVDGWSRNGWKKSDGKPVQNQDIMAELLKLRNTLGTRVTYEKVKGHSGVLGNERVDQLCNRVLDIQETEQLLS